MNIDFAVLVFCLTIVALVAISRGRDKLAERATDALSSLSQDILRVFKTHESDD